jgi:hypothetical protein
VAICRGGRCDDANPSLHADAGQRVLERGAPENRLVAHAGNDSLSFPAAGYCEGSLNCPHAPNLKRDLALAVMRQPSVHHKLPPGRSVPPRPHSMVKDDEDLLSEVICQVHVVFAERVD